MVPPRRWVVPRPGRDGQPLGVLKIEVVPAEAYDRLVEEHTRLAGLLAQAMGQKPFGTEQGRWSEANSAPSDDAGVGQ